MNEHTIIIADNDNTDYVVRYIYNDKPLDFCFNRLCYSSEILNKPN